MANYNHNWNRRPRVYVTRSIPQRGLDVLLNGCDVAQWDSPQVVPRGELLNSVRGVHGILCMEGDVIDKNVLDAAGNSLVVVATLSPTCGHIDEEECKRRGIRLMTLPLESTDFMADITVRLMLQTLRRTITNMQLDNNHICSNNNLKNKTIGIFGLNAMACAVARRLRDMHIDAIIAHDPSISVDDNNDIICVNHSYPTEILDVVSWEDLLRQSDVLMICTEEETSPYFDREAFQQMKKSAVLVSSLRAQCLDYWALYEALRNGDISAAGLNDGYLQPVSFKMLLGGLNNCAFLLQAEEGTSDLRHKSLVALTRNMLGSLNRNRLLNGIAQVDY